MLLFSHSIWGENSNSKLRISGIILDAEKSQAISNAVIQVLDTEIYFTSKEDGTFIIDGLIGYKHTLKITHISYQEKLIDIDLEANSDRSLIIYLIPRAINLSPVVVTDKSYISDFDELNEFSNVLKGKELQRNLGMTIASTLKNATGLAVRSMGPAPSRPVIRGLGQDRIFISEDGNKTIDLSSTSPDHAVTMEPFTINTIEVLRGPKVLTKTSTTIGGVVNAIRNEIPNEIHNQIHLNLGGYIESVNNGYLGSIQSEIPIKPFAIKLELSRRKSADQTTPVGKLNNSYSQNLNTSAGVSFIEGFGFVGASVRTFSLDYGVPGGFVGAHPNGVDIEMYRRQFNVESMIYLNENASENIHLKFSNNYYRHKEFEFSGRIGSEFRLINLSGSANISHSNISFMDNGILGVSFEYRDFDIGGFVFTPPTNSTNLSAYLFESLSTGRFSFEFGARYSFDNVVPEIENAESNIGPIKKRSFNNISFSVSGMYKISDVVYMGGNLSRSTRVPTIEELFSEGPHLAAYSYEIGNPLLESEKGYGTEFFIYHKFEKLFFNLNFFYNNLDSYIIPRNTGEINFQTFLPIYSTSSVGALLYGFDGQIDWKVTNKISISSSISFTNGQLKGRGSPLPQIPPLKGFLETKYSLDNFVVGLNIEWASNQNRVDEFEYPTAGYLIFNSFFQYVFSIGETVNNISLSIDNLFNKEYRNHLSRVKTILPESGRNFRLIYKVFI